MSTPESPLPSRRKVPVLAVLAIAGGGLAVVCAFCGGILYGVARPAFVGYLARSKTVEATTNLRALRVGITAYAMGESIDPATGAATMRGLPPSLPRTPAVPGAERQPWPASADPLWAELGLPTSEPHYYAYEIQSDRAANTIAVFAIGDLDGDGVTSEFVIDGRFDPQTGEMEWSQAPAITNELE